MEDLSIEERKKNNFKITHLENKVKDLLQA